MGGHGVPMMRVRTVILFIVDGRGRGFTPYFDRFATQVFQKKQFLISGLTTVLLNPRGSFRFTYDLGGHGHGQKMKNNFASILSRYVFRSLTE